VPISARLMKSPPTEYRSTCRLSLRPADRRCDVRGHVGTIELNHGSHVFPDVNSLGKGEDPHWLYTVRFDGRELWGQEGDPTLSVSVDVLHAGFWHCWTRFWH
jgi:Nitrile hydratase beta subunit